MTTVLLEEPPSVESVLKWRAISALPEAFMDSLGPVSPAICCPTSDDVELNVPRCQY